MMVNFIASIIRGFEKFSLIFSNSIRQKLNTTFKYLHYILFLSIIIYAATLLKLKGTSATKTSIIAIIIVLILIALQKVATKFLISSAKDEFTWKDLNKIYIPICLREQIDEIEREIQLWPHKPKGEWTVGLKAEDKIIFKWAGLKRRKLYLSAKLIDQQNKDVVNFAKYYLTKESNPWGNPMFFPLIIIIIPIAFYCNVLMSILLFIVLFRVVSLSLIKEIIEADVKLAQKIGRDQWRSFLDKSKNYGELYGIYVEERNIFSTILYYSLAFPLNINSKTREALLNVFLSDEEKENNLTNG